MWEQLKQLKAVNSGLNIHIYCSQWDKQSEWTCSIELKDNSLELKSNQRGETPEEAIDKSYETFMRLVQKGAPQMLKLIEHHTEEEVPEPNEKLKDLLRTNEDKIPF